MESIFVLIAYFSICAFFGKVIEFTYYQVRKDSKGFEKSGFLNGPFSPIYGFGGLAIYFYSSFSESFPLALNLLVYFLIPLTIEYVGAGLLEKIFDLKLWDYSKYKFNLKGKICLWVSFVWFLFAVLFVYVIQPFLLGILNNLSFMVVVIWALVFSVYFIIDGVLSSMKHLREKRRKV